MSTLTIGDLSFCETELDSHTLQGGDGITVSGPYGTWSSSNNSAEYSDYVATYSINGSTGLISTSIIAKYGGSVAGAIAGAISDNGNKYAFSSSSAHAV